MAPTRALVVILVVMVEALLGNKPASAQAWPAHSLTLVVPWAAGGGTDIMGRIMARRMSEILGQTVIVENLAGGGGMAGASHVARADADGYTFILGSRSE